MQVTARREPAALLMAAMGEPAILEISATDNSVPSGSWQLRRTGPVCGWALSLPQLLDVSTGLLQIFVGFRHTEPHEATSLRTFEERFARDSCHPRLVQ